MGADRAVAAVVERMLGRPFRDHRQVIEGIVYRYRAGIAWRDLPAESGPWQTVWKRHHRFSLDGTWDRLLSAVQADADAAGELNWPVSADSSVVRVHQHGLNAARSASSPGSYTGAPPNDKKRADPRDAPDDHGIGRSRGGLTTKAHLAVDGHERPLVVLVTAGQANGSPMFPPLLAELRVPRRGPGRPPPDLRRSSRTRPTPPGHIALSCVDAASPR